MGSTCFGEQYLIGKVVNQWDLYSKTSYSEFSKEMSNVVLNNVLHPTLVIVFYFSNI